MTTILSYPTPSYLSKTGLERDQAIFTLLLKKASKNTKEFVNLLFCSLKGKLSFAMAMPRKKFILIKYIELKKENAMLKAALLGIAIVLAGSLACNFLQYHQPSKEKEGKK